jgi:hypothetical protein
MKISSGQTKDYQLVFVAYDAKHADLRRKSKDLLARNQDNVSEWSNMYIRGLLFQLANTIRKKPQAYWSRKKAYLIIISLTHSLKLLRTVFVFPDNVLILCLFCNVL